jgi:hypothetical protein
VTKRYHLRVLLTTLDIDKDQFERTTGWALKPQGACKGEVCVPLLVPPEDVNAEVLSERLGMALVHDAAHGVWALGSETIAGRALSTAVASDFTLPDWKGGSFTLSSLRGQKVFLLAWASW